MSPHVTTARQGSYGFHIIQNGPECLSQLLKSSLSQAKAVRLLNVSALSGRGHERIQNLLGYSNAEARSPKRRHVQQPL